MPKNKTKSKGKGIPAEVQTQVEESVADFNKRYFGGAEIRYFARIQGQYVYLDRDDYGSKGPICRLKYTGDFEKWDFAIFKFSSETYDPSEDFFPGSEEVDGTLEGAMIAGLKAYPV